MSNEVTCVVKELRVGTRGGMLFFDKTFQSRYPRKCKQTHPKYQYTDHTLPTQYLERLGYVYEAG